MVTALEQTATSRYVPPYAIALVYLGLQRADAMFQWLERAYDARDVHLVFAPVDPKWDPVPRRAAFPGCHEPLRLYEVAPALHAIGSGLLLEPPCEAYELTLPGHMCTAGGVRADLVSADLEPYGLKLCQTSNVIRSLRPILCAGAVQNDAYLQDATPRHLGWNRSPQIREPASSLAVEKRTTAVVG